MRNALKVLIVDDDKSSSQMMSEAVRRMGFKPVVVNKATDALNVVRLQTVHAAVVDVLLPRMTGVELVQEFRSTRFADNPVVFVSGVFKDKVFSAEAIRKTNATAFLFKPFNVEELTEALTSSMQNQINAEKWSVQSLLTRRLSSDRERAKAIEHLEQIRGLDFPFVLSILMEVGSSGHLNIVNDAGEIFGVSLTNGLISEVDSSESQSSSILALVNRGFLSQEDLDELQKAGPRRVTLERLLNDGYVSPHAISEACRDQIMSDLRSICSAKTMQVNFVPQEESDQTPSHAVGLQMLMDMFVTSLDEFFPEDYLFEFYQSMMDAPIRMVHVSQSVMAVWENSQFKSLLALKSAIEKGQTLNQVLSQDGGKKRQIFQCLHYLVLIRAIMFDDLNRAKNLNSMLERYKNLFEQINGKSPDKVFEYFGASIQSNPTVFKTIWEEFSRSNNPAQLGKEATPELRELCTRCFEIIREAKDVMIDDVRRIALVQKIHDDQADRQSRSVLIVTEAYDLIRRGQPREAIEKLKEAERLFVNNRWHMIFIWADVKCGPAVKPRLADHLRKLESMASEERKNPLYHYVLGLAKKVSADPTYTLCFERALQIDPDFADAKRELTNPGARSSNEKVNIFTGDITEVVSQLFRRKPD